MIKEKSLLLIATGALIGIASSVLCSYFSKKNKPLYSVGVESLIGHTPMIEIKSLSQETGCKILAKMEMCNPGGSAKDRVALAIIKHAESQGLITPHHGDMIFEGTSGSTGISIAVLANALGYEAHIALPDDTSTEKVALLEALGATVHKVMPGSIVDDKHYVNYARRAAERQNQKGLPGDDTPRAIFADQFENLENWKIHYRTTGPEILRQTGGNVDAFVTGAGTGGTISGVSMYLKENLGSNILTVLADPQGSGLHAKVKHGVMFDPATEREGTRRRHQVDTIVEGIGINRVTANFKVGLASVDDSIRISDQEAKAMATRLVKDDGIFVGSSSAVHCAAAYKLAKELGPGHVIVTIICDSGARHLSKFWKVDA